MTDLVPAFLNALQLSLSSPILAEVQKHPRSPILIFHFAQNINTDKNIQKFLDLLKPNLKWLDKNTLEWNDASEENLQTLTEILILTRLNDQNLIKLAGMNAKFEPWIKKLNLADPENKNLNLHNFIFSQMQKKQISQSQIAKNADLSLVSLYKFKKGGDIRLSNFIKILDALNLEIQIKERK